MAKINKTEEKKPKIYDGLDLRKMAEEVDAIKIQRRGGTLKPRFDLYCESKKLLRYGHYGETIICDAGGYHAACEMWAEIQKVRAPKMAAEHARLEQLDKMKPETEQLAKKMQIRKCVMCPNTLSQHLSHYCSGSCLARAREQGIYGREEQHLEAINAID